MQRDRLARELEETKRELEESDAKLKDRESPQQPCHIHLAGSVYMKEKDIS